VKPIVHLALAVALSGLQASLVHHLGGGAWTACLLAPLLAHLALTAGNVEGALGAAAVGVVLDLSSGTPAGLSTFLAVATFLAARVVGAAVEVRGRVGFAALSGAAALSLSAGGVAMLRLAAAEEVRPGWGLAPRLLGEALLTALAAPLLQLLLQRLDALLGAEEPDLIR
jgi:rod shape-determining protein MreD